MSLTYSTYVTSLANLFPTGTTDPGFVTVLPNIIDDAEQRIYRELDILQTNVTDASAAFTTGTRIFNLPSSIGTYVVLNDVYAITPAGTSNPDLGTRNALTPVSRETLDFLFPSSNGSGVPSYFAMSTQFKILVGPWPDQAYQAEVNGTQRPTPLSASNVTTFLSVYLPDLFLAASMMFGSAYMKNFGAQSDNPQMAQSWESHYQALKGSAEVEEARKKFTSQGWSSKQPAQLATPART